MLCSKCGTPSQGNVCPVCGNTDNLNNGIENIPQQPEQPNTFEQPQPNMFEQPNEYHVENNNHDKEPKKKFNFKIVLAGIGAVAIIAVVLAFVTGTISFSNSSSSSKKGNYKLESEYFFLSNGSKYAIFDIKGNQITDFIYTNNSYFHNGIAYVNENNVSKIIDEKGNTIVENNYPVRTVSSEYSLYTVYENGNSKLYTAKGKEVVQIPSTAYGIKSVQNHYLLALIDENYILYNKDGKELINVKEEEAKTEFLQYGLHEKYDYVLAFVQGKNYLFDTNTDSLITTFDSEQQYCMDKLDDGRVLLSHCNDLHSKQQKDKKIIDNNKVYSIPTECTTVSLNGTQLVCTTEGSKTNLISDDYKLGRTFNGKDYEQFFDEDNYVLISSRKANFYKDGKLVKTVDEQAIKSTYFTVSQVEDFYTLYDNKENLYYCYNKEGKKLFNKGFAGIDKTSEGVYRVRTTEGKYYLINNKGKKISKEYDNIYVQETDNNKYLEVTEGSIKKILDKNEKKVIYSCPKDSDVYIRTKLGMDYAYIDGSTYAIVDLKTGNELVTSTSKIYDNEEKYIRVDNTYYTYTGKLIYEK